jgi:hypothetical protein
MSPCGALPEAVKAAVREKMGLGILFYNLIEEDIKRKDLKTMKFPGLPKLVETAILSIRRTSLFRVLPMTFLPYCDP